MPFNLEKDVAVIVSIVIGSESDLELANKCSGTLDSLSITNSIQVLSAHRTPELLSEHIKEAESSGTKVFIAMAGLAAHLAGSVAAKTLKPVIGVPVDGGPLKGIDALLSTVQMPKGIPVATFAIGEAGSYNAGLFAVSLIAVSDKEVKKNLNEFREEQVTKVLNMKLEPN